MTAISIDDYLDKLFNDKYNYFYFYDYLDCRIGASSGLVYAIHLDDKKIIIMFRSGNMAIQYILKINNFSIVVDKSTSYLSYIGETFGFEDLFAELSTKLSDL